jgi:hypothetical protein
MNLISVRDLSKPRAIQALKVLRERFLKGREPVEAEEFNRVYDLIGGRMAYLNKVAKSENMLEKCREICDAEKTWLLVC